MSKSPDLIEMPNQSTKSEELIKAEAVDTRDCSQRWCSDMADVVCCPSQSKMDSGLPNAYHLDLIQRGKIDPGIDPFGDISEPMGCVCPLQHGPIDHPSKLKPYKPLTPIQNELIPKLFRNR